MKSDSPRFVNNTSSYEEVRDAILNALGRRDGAKLNILPDVLRFEGIGIGDAKFGDAIRKMTRLKLVHTKQSPTGRFQTVHLGPDPKTVKADKITEPIAEDVPIVHRDRVDLMPAVELLVEAIVGLGCSIENLRRSTDSLNARVVASEDNTEGADHDQPVY